MYNKIFTKILDSSIWLEPLSTRIVWITLIAAMDQDGFAQFAALENLAHRARVSVDEAADAVAALEGPDLNSSDPENDGRRIERMPGGWLVLNAVKYRDIVTMAVSRERTRLRVQAHRAAKKASVTGCNADVTPCNKMKQSVTQSEAVSEAYTHTPKSAPTPSSILLIYESYPKKVDKPQALRAIKKAVVEFGYALVFERTKAYAEARSGEDPKYTPTPAKWFNGQRFNDDPSTWKNEKHSPAQQKLVQNAGGQIQSPDGTLFPIGARM